MIFNIILRIDPNHPSFRGINTQRVIRDKSLIGNSSLIFSILLLIILTTGCSTPKVQPMDPQLLYKSDMLSFIRDGVTTREEVLVKLGIPSAQIEGDRILMYQLRMDNEGKWHLVAPNWSASSGMRAWAEGTCSLVLVFGEGGILKKHSMVIPQ